MKWKCFSPVLSIPAVALFLCVPAAVVISEDRPQHLQVLGSRDSELEKTLNETVARLLEAIRKKDNARFLSLVSRAGMGIGADGQTSYREIQKEFKERRDAYCLYFDTTCWQAELTEIGHKPGEDLDGILPFPVSYHQVLNTVTGLEVHTEIRKLRDTSEPFGSVTVRWKSPRPRDLGLTSFLNFGFVLEKGKWRLRYDTFP